MKFKNGIWLGALENSLLNLGPLLLVATMLMACYLAIDVGFGGGAGTWVSIMVWLYLAIPAHYTALNGQSGWQSVVGGKFNRSFLWRAGVLSLSGFLGLMLTLPLLKNLSTDVAIGYGVLAFAATEIIILAFVGTWLPSVFIDGDKRIKTAFQRARSTFWYVFLRLLFCNGLVLTVAVIAFGALNKKAGYDQMYTSGTGIHLLVIVAYLVLVVLFSFHVVMLATILSRAYLIAEDKIKSVNTASSA
jgi:hypothetical protein